MKGFFRNLFGFNKSSSNHLHKSMAESNTDNGEGESFDYEKENSLYLSFNSDGSSNAVTASNDIGSSIYTFNVKIGDKGIRFSPVPTLRQTTASFSNNISGAIARMPNKKDHEKNLGFAPGTLTSSTPLNAPPPPLPVKPIFDTTVPFGKQVKTIDENIRKYEQRMAKTVRIIKRLMSGKNPTADDLFSIEDENSEDEEDNVLDLSMRSSPMPTEKGMDDLCQRSNRLLNSWEMLHNCLLEGIGMDAIRPKELSERLFGVSRGKRNQSETE